MFNIIETSRNYFTCRLLHDNLRSDVALHFNVSHWRPYLVVSCSEEVFCRPSTAPVCVYVTKSTAIYSLAHGLHITAVSRPTQPPTLSRMVKYRDVTKLVRIRIRQMRIVAFILYIYLFLYYLFFAALRFLFYATQCAI